MKNLLGESEVPITDKYFNFLVLSFSLLSCLEKVLGRGGGWEEEGIGGRGWPKLPTEAIHSQGNLEEVKEMKEEIVSFIYCSYFLSGIGFKFYLFCFI